MFYNFILDILKKQRYW